MNDREFLCEEVKLTTWDDITEMADVGWKATFKTGDLEMTIELTGDGIPEFRAGRSYIWNAQEV